LEVGCGFGWFLQKLLDRNVRCAGLEFNPRAVETAASNGLQVYPETISDHVRNNPDKYNVVCAFQILEHIGAAGDFYRGLFEGDQAARKTYHQRAEQQSLLVQTR
jgi:2-polyprenyl-3-methyl-5-hydroxy-6-metoxy-1,4-benzoquinol methylase